MNDVSVSEDFCGLQARLDWQSNLGSRPSLSSISATVLLLAVHGPPPSDPHSTRRCAPACRRFSPSLCSLLALAVSAACCRKFTKPTINLADPQLADVLTIFPPGVNNMDSCTATSLWFARDRKQPAVVRPRQRSMFPMDPASSESPGRVLGWPVTAADVLVHAHKLAPGRRYHRGPTIRVPGGSPGRRAARVRVVPLPLSSSGTTHNGSARALHWRRRGAGGSGAQCGPDSATRPERIRNRVGALPETCKPAWPQRKRLRHGKACSSPAT